MAWAFNAGMIRWLGNKFPVQPTDQGVLTSFKMQWWNNAAAASENFQVDVFALNGTLLGSSQTFQVQNPAPVGYVTVNLNNPIAFTGPFYALIKWNNFTGPTHWLGYDQNGPYISSSLAYGYDGTTFTGWPAYSGAAPGVFCLRACGNIAGAPATLNPAGGDPVSTGQTPAIATNGELSHCPEGEEPPVFSVKPETDAPLATGLIGYNIYRSQGGPGGPWTLIKHLVTYPDSLSWYDENLIPNTWCYKVTACYDLTAFGFPGQFNESLPVGPQCTTTNNGRTLPFCEHWEGGNFGLNHWQFGSGGAGNWSVIGSIGNSPPGAAFSREPIRTGYSYGLESPALDATQYTCAKLWLDFDYKLEDIIMNSTEKLTVEVYYDNVWHWKAEFLNNGNVNWTSKHIDISLAKGKSFRVRFRANGLNSANIQYWGVDNICVSAVCTPPSALTATHSGSNTALTWTAPDCLGGIPTNLIFDDGTVENGWGINPGYNSWIGNQFPLSSTTSGVIQKVKFYFWYNPSRGTDKLTIDFFDAAH
ncbi:MAG: hypothetical protein WCK09_20695, partial [Bacteroidota bacterium]